MFLFLVTVTFNHTYVLKVTGTLVHTLLFTEAILGLCVLLKASYSTTVHYLFIAHLRQFKVLFNASNWSSIYTLGYPSNWRNPAEKIVYMHTLTLKWGFFSSAAKKIHCLFFSVGSGTASQNQPDPPRDSRPELAVSSHPLLLHGRYPAIWLYLHSAVFHLEQSLVR